MSGRDSKGVNKQTLQLGEAVPVPSGPDDALELLESPTAKRSKEGDHDARGGKRGKSESRHPPQITLETESLREMLREQSYDLLGKQQAQLDKAIGDLECRTLTKVAEVQEQIAHLESRHSASDSRIEALERGLREVTDKIAQGAGGHAAGRDPGDEKRRNTLVIGGWPKDSRRGVILADLQEALRGLRLEAQHDAEPFCTGPRRSIALLPMPKRQGETEQGHRDRMFSFVQAFGGTQVLTKTGAKLWCNFSKSPEQRIIASHSGLIKKVVGSLVANSEGLLDFEYKTGTTWCDEGMISSACLPVPPGTDMRGISVDDNTVRKHWINIPRLARVTGCSIEEASVQPVLPLQGQCTESSDEFKFKVFGWNVGGCDIADLGESFREGCKASLPDDALLTLQELPRGDPGWAKQKCGKWSVVSHRAQGSAHFVPGCTLAQYEQAVEETFERLPKSATPVVFQCDANAPIRWCWQGGEVYAVGRDAKANDLQSRMMRRGFRMVEPRPLQFLTPTSRPRQEGRKGHIIDVMACKGLNSCQLVVHEGSFQVLGTDHEILEATFCTRGGRQHVRHSTKPRVWVGGVIRITHVDQHELERLGQKCTRPKRGESYVDPPEVKQAAQHARLMRTNATWTRVRQLRKAARKEWENQRLQRASLGDWAALRAVRKKADTGWAEGFAEAQKGDPHQAVHDHLEGVYKGDPPQQPQKGFQGEVKAFTEDELDVALGQLQAGKAVGGDGTSKELLAGICSVEGGKQHLLEFLTRILATQSIPEQWNTPLMVLLPKIQQPMQPKDLRPISMSSGVSNLFSRLLLNRALHAIDLTSHSQCSGRGRQTADYIFTIWRTLELEREWRRGVCFAKLDIAKAFDALDRRKVLEYLATRLGESAELECWKGLLQQNYSTLQTPWGTSSVLQQRGIKQGAIESPLFFALISELCLTETAHRYQWHKQEQAFQGCSYQEMLYMDDSLLWGRGTEGLETRIRQFMVVLSEFGLRLNGSKCQLLVSPHWKGPKFIHIAGTKVEASPEMEVMGLHMRVGMSPCELVGPLLARAKAKFWATRHIFCAKTPLKGRLRVIERVVGASALWCLSALPPDKGAMGLLNSTQQQIVSWAMRLGKHRDESWEAYNKRSHRLARAAIHGAGLERWGTLWLRKWWRYSGHRARGLLREVPPISSQVDAFRTLSWWETEQRKDDGLQHTHHFPRLMNMERVMDRAAGVSWRVLAQDRVQWQGKEQVFVHNMDIPWASFRQYQLLNWQ
ncbi:pol [Symbiodinium sp. CCMP2456]|nr:pol [Symbiodinium sp. CCMP2456]